MEDRKFINRLKVVLAEKHKTNKWLADALDKDPATVNKVIYNPPLSAKNQTFPFIYYVCKWKVIAKKDDLPGFFNTLITTKIE